MEEIVEFKCVGCGNPLLSSNAVDGLVTCDYCFMPRAVPTKKTDPAALKLLRDGENELLVCDFSRAEAFFRKAASLAPEEPLIWWNLALATFCVQYLKDEVTGRVQPICHEISQKLFCQSEPYIKAVALSGAKQRALFEQQAGEIDSIRKEFFALKAQGLDYDCFLCVKVTDEEGVRTSDYKDADDVYFELRGKGYKPFFSERELAGAVGANYEARILYALQTAKCMLIVCHNERYLNTPWVKNEYVRFSNLMQNEEKDSDALAVAFRGTVIERLPGRKGKLQGVDLNSVGAMEKILDYVDRHTVAGKELRARREKEREEALARRMEAQAKAIKDLQDKIDAQDVPPSNRAQIEEKAREEAMRLFVVENNVLVRYKGVKCEEDETIPVKISKKVNSAINTVTDTVNSVMSTFGLPTQQRKNAPPDFDKITQIKVPDFITEIGEKAFFGCEKLAEITLPKNLRYIHGGAFEGCTALKKINFPAGLATVGDYAFRGCKSLLKINMPNSVVDLGRGAFAACSHLSEATVSESVTAIKEETFAGCYDLKVVTLSNHLYDIGRGAFAHCRSLAHLTARRLVYIGVSAFTGCSSLKGVEISAELKLIKNKAFSGCTSLRVFELKSYAAEIGANVFYGCKRLKIYCARSEKSTQWHRDWNVKGRFIFKLRAKTYWGVSEYGFNALKEEQRKKETEKWLTI